MKNKRTSIKRNINKRKYGRYSKKYGKRGGDYLKPSTWKPSTWFSSSAWGFKQPSPQPTEEEIIQRAYTADAASRYVGLDQNVAQPSEINKVRKLMNAIFSTNNVVNNYDICRILRDNLGSMERNRLMEIVRTLNVPKSWKEKLEELNLGCEVINEDRNAVKVKEWYNNIIKDLIQNKYLENTSKDQLQFLKDKGHLVEGDVTYHPIEEDIVEGEVMYNPEQHEGGKKRTRKRRQKKQKYSKRRF